MFKNLDDATKRLLKQIPKLEGEGWLFLAISDNGEKIASQIARNRKLPYKRLHMEPVHCPKNRECQIAVVTELGNIQIDTRLQDAFNLDGEDIENLIELTYQYKLLPKLKKKRIQKFELLQDIEKVIIIDEAIETGLRMEGAISTLTELFDIREIYIAVPIIPQTIFEIFEDRVEEIFFIEKVDIYTGIENYYIENLKKVEK